MHRLILLVAVLVAALGAQPARASSITVTEVRVNLNPDPVAVNGIATLNVFVQQGMNCTASYNYASKTGVKPVSFAKRNVGRTGHTSWAWKVITKAGAGIAYVTCTLSQPGGTFTETASLGFAIGGSAVKTSPGIKAVVPTNSPILPTSTPVPPTNTPVPSQPTPTQVPAQAPLTVQVAVSPDLIPYGAFPTVTVHTAPGAACTISVIYDTGRHPTSYPAHTATADAGGTIVEQGQWHMESKGSSGTVQVTCTLAGNSASNIVNFAISG